MLVDQDDTPLFLGAIHRTFPDTTLADLLDASRAAGAHVDPHERHQALLALDSTHFVLTDGDSWHVVTPPALPQDAPVSWVHDAVLPLLSRPEVRVVHHHNVDEALAAAGPAAPAVLLPSPDFDQVRASSSPAASSRRRQRRSSPSPAWVCSCVR